MYLCLEKKELYPEHPDPSTCWLVYGDNKFLGHFCQPDDVDPCWRVFPGGPARSGEALIYPQELARELSKMSISGQINTLAAWVGLQSQKDWVDAQVCPYEHDAEPISLFSDQEMQRQDSWIENSVKTGSF